MIMIQALDSIHHIPCSIHHIPCRLTVAVCLHRLDMSIPDVPFVITWGAINVAEGILILLVAKLAFVIAIAQLRSLAMPFAILSFFCYVVQLALYATTQVAFLSYRICYFVSLTSLYSTAWISDVIMCTYAVGSLICLN